MHQFMAERLQELLAESARRYPHNIAVVQECDKVTYAELDFLSGLLCSALINKSAPLPSRIGILMDKSIDAVISIFAILKSGSSYLPLDPAWPLSRQINIINNSGLEHLIVSAKKLPIVGRLFESGCNLKCIFVTDMRRADYRGPEKGAFVFKDDILAQKEAVCAKEGGAGRLAYILYTSGSTGSPKGVMISHKASLAFVNWAYRYFNINNNDRFISVSPFYFDLSIFDIFASIKAGAVLYLSPSGIFAFPRTAADFIKKNKITTLYSVPSILIQLILHGGLEEKNLSCLKRIIFAGDVFPVKYLRMLMRALPGCFYYNLYGPTETNVCAAHSVKEIPEEGMPLPIGIPCEGTEIFIIDENERLCNNNEIGQICVKGPTVMEGYWNDVGRTESVFFIGGLASKGLNGKVYKTGDLGRIDEEGRLWFHGRKDRLIKSGGYRIELDEVEVAIKKHPAVKEAIVWAVPDAEKGNRIKAAILPQKKNALCEEGVKRFCRENLPYYMIPQEIVFTEAMPTTATGKIDRTQIESLCLKDDNSNA